MKNIYKADKRKIYKLWKLFYENAILSSCTFGGGFVIVTMMKKKFSEDLQWISEDEILDMASVAQASPGSIAVNMSIIVGYKIYGIIGATMSALGTIFPPLLIISLISIFYNLFRDSKYIAICLQVMRSGVAAVIFDVVISLAYNIFKTKNVIWISLMFLSFIASFFFKVNAIIIILICAIVALLQYRKNA